MCENGSVVVAKDCTIFFRFRETWGTNGSRLTTESIGKSIVVESETVFQGWKPDFV